ncbi:uncharacterized protein LOC129402039 [Sorex araneus]|uniref:uncharacterized protein LOC129402039 n=1 Tax=Sorex araneus TaxID=42254 RepID=UPI002433C4F0|nr:uncharacterized protein LOC129402039 [Sorex araneus]
MGQRGRPLVIAQQSAFVVEECSARDLRKPSCLSSSAAHLKGKAFGMQVWRTVVEQFYRKLGPRAVEDVGTLWPQHCGGRGDVAATGLCGEHLNAAAVGLCGHQNAAATRRRGGLQNTTATALMQDVGTQQPQPVEDVRTQPACRTLGHSSHSPRGGRRDTATARVQGVGARQQRLCGMLERCDQLEAWRMSEHRGPVGTVWVPWPRVGEKKLRGEFGEYF